MNNSHILYTGEFPCLCLCLSPEGSLPYTINLFLITWKSLMFWFWSKTLQWIASGLHAYQQLHPNFTILESCACSILISHLANLSFTHAISPSKFKLALILAPMQKRWIFVTIFDCGGYIKLFAFTRSGKPTPGHNSQLNMSIKERDVQFYWQFDSHVGF